MKLATWNEPITRPMWGGCSARRLHYERHRCEPFRRQHFQQHCRWVTWTSWAFLNLGLPLAVMKSHDSFGCTTERAPLQIESGFGGTFHSVLALSNSVIIVSNVTVTNNALGIGQYRFNISQCWGSSGQAGGTGLVPKFPNFTRSQRLIVERRRLSRRYLLVLRI